MTTGRPVAPLAGRGTVIAVVGPTGTGKSDLGVELALALGGEVVNADSMQLYAGMDVGTAKLTQAQRRGVPHHLLDIWPVTCTASVADYQRQARGCIDALLDAGKTALLVGGSGLYIRAVLDDMVFPGTDAGVRAALEAELAEVGAPAMHRRLAATRPEAAALILPSNGRRIVRALEVAAIGGGVFTGAMPARDSVYDAVLVGLDRPTAELDDSLARRVEHMWRHGLVTEVEALAGHGLRDGVTARRALGYRQVLAAIDGEISLDDAKARTVQATRRFARRQRSWFRPDQRIHWISPGPQALDDAVAVVQR